MGFYLFYLFHLQYILASLIFQFANTFIPLQILQIIALADLVIQYQQLNFEGQCLVQIWTSTVSINVRKS